MVRRFLACVLIVFGLLAACAQAQAPDATQRAQFFDASSKVRVVDLASAPWAPSTPHVRLGLQTGTLWLKLGRTVPAGQALYLYLLQANVDQVTVYAVDAAFAPVPGSAQTLSATELQGGKLLLSAAASATAHTYYVQIQSKGLHWVSADVLTGDERSARLHREAMVWSAQLTFVVLACIGALFQWLQTRRPVYLGLLGINTVFVLYRLNLNGTLIDLLGLDAQRFVALSTALMVMGLAGLALVLRWMFPPLPSQPVHHGRLRSYALALLVLAALAFSLERRLAILSALLLVLVVLSEITVYRYQAWRSHRTKAALGSADLIAFLPCVLLIGGNIAVFMGLFPFTLFALTVHDLRQFNWPVLCTLMYLTLVHRYLHERTLVQTALATTAEQLQLEVARRGTQQHFIAMLVHEIRGPLTVIELGQRALSQGPRKADETAPWAQRIQSATDTIGQIVENCTQVDRLESGSLAVAMAEVAIAPLVSDTVDRLRHTVPGAAERIQTVYAPEALRAATCRGDRQCLGTALTNLLANALKYAAAGSPIVLQVSAVQRGGRACVEFAVHNDPGDSGMPDPARVFERYYRAPTATQVAGTGLGLWLSQNLARQMHSEIRLAPAGARIVFSFAVERVTV